MSTGQVSRDWVADSFGVTLTDVSGDGLPGRPVVGELVRLALRRNPRRAHLLVSTVLGKHLPVDPRTVRDHGLRLGDAVCAELDGEPAVVLGFAETATGLGHLVAQALAAPYLHSTRRHVPGVAPLAGFEEEHSHASSHLLLPEDAAMLAGQQALVLVDDELSTGRTALNTIRALHHVDRRRYVIATLVDLRSPEDRDRMQVAARELSARIAVVSLARGRVDWPAEFPGRAAGWVAGVAQPEPVTGVSATVREVPARWPVGVRDGGRHGYTAADGARARVAAEAVAAHVGRSAHSGRMLVLGVEELMYAPMLIACALAEGGHDVRLSSTTRSPVLAQDIDGYPIRNVVTWTGGLDSEGGSGPRYAYNVHGFDEIVVVSDRDEPALLEAVAAVCPEVRLVRLPSHVPTPPVLRGPGFGSYPMVEVGWLLTDLSDVELEAPTEEREEAIQSGGAHYAESLPVEYQPDDEYQALFETALAGSATRIAHAVGIVTEIVLAERGPDAVFTSLARAGTPIGALLRRWAAFAHGLDVPHYAISIVRGRGIDTVALRTLADRYDPSQIVFVDGWTGKGAIVSELTEAIERVNSEWATTFDPALAVLADPGSCVRTFGTREDYLIPSACLNSTVSGLVSRTVLNSRLLAPGQFHGAKFYRDLAPVDVSRRFVDTISNRFADVADAVARGWQVARDADRAPTWTGRRRVEELSEQYGIGDVTLVKPGVGETTRVLLRRVPWAVLVDPSAGAELAHVRLLAQRRGVEVHEVENLGYSCVGLIHPKYTRGATGADGRTAVHT